MAEKKEELTLEEQSERLFRVAIKSPEHLKKWLKASGRGWIVLKSDDLVDGLPFPAGHDTLIQLIACYRDHRMTKPSYRTEIQKDIKGKDVEVPIMKTDLLEVEEIDHLIRHLIGKVTELKPDWDINKPLT